MSSGGGISSKKVTEGSSREARGSLSNVGGMEGIIEL